MRSYYILFTLLIGFLFSFCNNNKEPLPFPEVTTDTTAVIGSWTRKTPQNEVVEVFFHVDKTYSFTRYADNGQPFVLDKGTYKNTEYSFTLLTSADTECVSYKAEYFYTVTKNNISFNPQAEACDKRFKFLIGEWKKN
jgi:hypothetical protein